MDLRQLAALVAVADRHSFSAAARALHTVQSNVSTHVAHLERELGVTLVDRASGALTEEGELVVARARRVQAEVEAIVADVAALHDDVAGGVRLGVIGTTARWLVPRVLEAVRDAHPKLEVVVVEATTTTLCPQLVEGQLDLAVVNMPVTNPDLVGEVLFDEDLLVLAPSDHPLGGRERVTLTELAEHPLLLEPPGTAFRDDLDAEAGRSGVQLRAQAEIDGLRLVASLAFEGFGAAIVPASAVPGWLTGDWTRVGVDGLARRQVGLARRRRGLPSAPTKALVARLREVVERERPRQPGLHPPSTGG